MSKENELKKSIKRQLGLELGEIRRNKNLTLAEVSKAAKTKDTIIDSLEIGRPQSWSIYSKLLNAYNKDIAVSLCEPEKDPAL